MPQVKSITLIQKNNLNTWLPGGQGGRGLCSYLCGARYGELQGKEQLSAVLKVVWKCGSSALVHTPRLTIVSVAVAVYVDLGY